MLRFAAFLALATLCVAVPMGGPNEETLKLVKLPDAIKTHGAMCMDGTPYAFYYAPAATPAGKLRTQIFFEGGGWCYNEEDCLGRSTGDLGSSKAYGPTSGGGGLYSGDCNVNPDFCDANRVILKYCDGNSFSGMRVEPLVVRGTNLFFRGRSNLDAALDWLLVNGGLASSEGVLLTGCSAGGLSTFLHADYVGEVLRKSVPTLKVYKAAPLSGYFLPHDTVEGKSIYADEIKTIFGLTNATYGVNQACIAALPAAEQWKCNFATESYKHTVTPMFPINSALDSWQTACIFTAEPVYDELASHANGNCSAAPGWDSCGWNYNECDSTQMKSMIQFETDFSTGLKATPQFNKAGNGGFYYSCHTHCASCGGGYNSIAVNGVTMQKAFSKWWNSPVDAPAADNTYMPCTHHDTAPYQCNPTCGSSEAEEMAVKTAKRAAKL